MIAGKRLIVEPRHPATIRALSDAPKSMGRAECECGHSGVSFSIGRSCNPDGEAQAGGLQSRPVSLRARGMMALAFSASFGWVRREPNHRTGISTRQGNKVSVGLRGCV